MRSARKVRAALTLLGAVCAVAAVVMLAFAAAPVPSASAFGNGPSRAAAPAHQVLAASGDAGYSGTWAFIAVVALCTTGVAAMVVFGGRRSNTRTGESRRTARR